MPEKKLTQKEKEKLVEPFIKKPSVTAHTLDKAENKRIAELSQNLEPRLFSFGPGAQFMYDIASGYFTAVEASFEDVTGYPPNEVVLADATSFITQLVLEEHLLVISNLILHSYEICQQRKGKDESIAVHMEYNIKTKTGLNKRVIIQYTPLVYEKDGYPRITEGRISDISHFKKDGLPLLYVIADNRLVHFEQADPKDMVRSKNVLFSKKELEILKLVSEGFSIKEVAARLKTSISTIYTHRKNIRQKSQEDINKIIVDLKQRGLI